MSEPNIVESLPDRTMKQSEIEQLGDSDAVDWVEPLMTGTRERSNMVSAWILEANGTAHVLLHEIDGWAPQGSFDTRGLDEAEKRERGDEVLDF